MSTHPEPRIGRLESVVVRAGGRLEEVTWSVIDGDHLATVQVSTPSGSHALGLRLEEAGALLSIDDSQALELEDDEWSSVVHELLLAAYSSELQVRRVGGSITAFRAGGLELHVADHGRFRDLFRRGSRTSDWGPL